MKHVVIFPGIFILFVYLAGQPFPVISATGLYGAAATGISLTIDPGSTDLAEIHYQPDTSAASSNSNEIKLRVFPNPATDFVRIEWQALWKPEIHAELYDLFGRRLIIENTESSDNHIQIDVQSLQRSAYLLKISSSDGRFSRTYRIIKY